MYTLTMENRLKAMENSAKLDILRQEVQGWSKLASKFPHSHLLGSYDDTEMEPLDEYFHAREVEPLDKQTNEPLPF